MSTTVRPAPVMIGQGQPVGPETLEIDIDRSWPSEQATDLSGVVDRLASWMTSMEAGGHLAHLGAVGPLWAQHVDTAYESICGDFQTAGRSPLKKKDAEELQAEEQE